MSADYDDDTKPAEPSGVLSPQSQALNNDEANQNADLPMLVEAELRNRVNAAMATAIEEIVISAIPHVIERIASQMKNQMGDLVQTYISEHTQNFHATNTQSSSENASATRFPTNPPFREEDSRSLVSIPLGTRTTRPALDFYREPSYSTGEANAVDAASTPAVEGSSSQCANQLEELVRSCVTKHAKDFLPTAAPHSSENTSASEPSQARPSRENDRPLAGIAPAMGVARPAMDWHWDPSDSTAEASASAPKPVNFDSQDDARSQILDSGYMTGPSGCGCFCHITGDQVALSCGDYLFTNMRTSD